MTPEDLKAFAELAAAEGFSVLLISQYLQTVYMLSSKEAHAIALHAAKQIPPNTTITSKSMGELKDFASRI